MLQRKGSAEWRGRGLRLFTILTVLVSALFLFAAVSTATAQIMAPTNVSISPSSGTLGTAAITLTSVYDDADGYGDIRYCYLLVNDSLGQSNAVVALFDRMTNRVYLKNDAGTSWGTGYTPGSAVVLQNNQCFLRVAETSAVGAGSSFTVNWRIALKEPFATKALNAYMYVRDYGSFTDGWDKMGSYFNSAPEVLSVDPLGPLPIDSYFTMNSHYRDLNGYMDVRKCYLLINDKFDQKNAVFIWYDKLSNKVYLKKDDNTSWGAGYGLTTPVILSNSQCEVDVGNTHISIGGTDLTVNWSIKLKTSMENKNLYSWMYVTDSQGAHDGWQLVGTHFTPIAPVCLYLGPTSGTVSAGFEQTFSTIYSDDNGWEDIHRAYLQLSVTSSQANAVLLMYDAKQNKVYLKNDANNSWGTGYAPGSANVLENSQCTVDLSTMLTPNGVTDEQLEIFWPVTIKRTQISKKLQERMYVIDNEGLTSGWKYKGVVLVN